MNDAAPETHWNLNLDAVQETKLNFQIVLLYEYIAQQLSSYGVCQQYSVVVPNAGRLSAPLPATSVVVSWITEKGATTLQRTEKQRTDGHQVLSKGRTARHFPSNRSQQHFCVLACAPYAANAGWARRLSAQWIQLKPIQSTARVHWVRTHFHEFFWKKVQNTVLQNWTFLILTQVFSSCYVVDDKEKSWHALKRSDYFALKKSVKSTWVDFQSQQSPIFGWFSSHFYIIAKVSLYYWKNGKFLTPFDIGHERVSTRSDRNFLPFHLVLRSLPKMYLLFSHLDKIVHYKFC